MAAFTFEKISPDKRSPSARREPVPVAPETRPRGGIVQIFGRFAESRVHRKTKGLIARNEGVAEKPARD